MKVGHLVRVSYRTDHDPDEPEVAPTLSADIPINDGHEIVDVLWGLKWVHVTFFVKGPSPIAPADYDREDDDDDAG